MLSLSRPPVLLAADPADPARLLPAPEPAGSSRSGAVPGVVVFTTHRGERAEAILDVAGRWRCPKLPVLDRVLNILFVPGAKADSPFGYDQLERVAAWIKGTVQGDSRGA